MSIFVLNANKHLFTWEKDVFTIIVLLRINIFVNIYIFFMIMAK